jgi:hypothetical protein
MRWYRRIVFVLSLAVAAAIYAGLYLVAPSVLLMSANAAPRNMPKPLEVRLYNGPMPEPVPPEDVITTALASRPGSVRDLIKEATEELPIAEPKRDPAEGPADAAPPPAPRAEALAREHDLARNDALLGGMEARLVAIPEASARSIEVPRRFIAENDTRILATENQPMLVDGSGAPPSLSLPSGSAAPASAAAPIPAATEAAMPEQPSVGLLEPAMERPSPTVPGLADETLLARESLVNEVRGNNPFDSMEGLVRLEAATYVDPASREGYFRLKIIPREDALIAPLPRDVTFVIDASNSIVQRKLDLTVRGVISSFALLRPEDQFNVIVFRDTPKPFREVLVPASPENVAEAKKFLEGIESGGSTDVYGAVAPVLLTPPRPGGPGLVVVLSDGRPTTGNLEGRELIRRLSEQNVAGNTVYTFGGGNTVNRYLMDLLAYRNRGQSQIADDIEDVDNDLPAFFKRLQDALLVDLHADYGRVDEASVFPQAMPDFYRGRVVTVYGKFRPGQEDDLVLRLQGRAGEEQKEIVLKADLAGAEKGTREIAEGWAFEKTYHLIGEITEVGETPEIMGEIRRLSDQFDVRTSYSP